MLRRGVCWVMAVRRHGFLNKSPVTALLAGDFKRRRFASALGIHAFAPVGGALASADHGGARVLPPGHKSLSIIHSWSVAPPSVSRLSCRLFGSPSPAQNTSINEHTCVRPGASWKVRARRPPRGQALKSLKPALVSRRGDAHALLKHDLRR